MNFVAIITKREKCSSWEEFGNRDVPFISLCGLAYLIVGIYTVKGGMDSQIISKYIISLKTIFASPQTGIKADLNSYLLDRNGTMPDSYWREKISLQLRGNWPLDV